MPDETKNELLINALLDDQLDAADAQRASQQIANDNDLSEMLASFEEQRSAIADLPKFQLGEDFADRIVEIGAAEVAAVPTVNRPAAPVSKVDWKRYAMSLAAIAALLMGMLVYQWTPGGQEMAVLTPAADAPGTTPPADDDRIDFASKDMSEILIKAYPPMGSAGDFDESTDAAPEPGAMAAVSSPPPLGSKNRTSNRQLMAKGDQPLNETDDELEIIEAEDFQASSKKTADYAFLGTPMSAPEPQSQPAIDQVWLMEVGEKYSQNQLVKALTSNSISVPAELQSSGERSDAAVAQDEVDGIQVAAKRSQMKRALSQLSQSDAVTISAFQLPNQAASSNVVNRLVEAGVAEPSEENGGFSGDAITTIATPSRAMAQKLRGNYFAPPTPSSKVPKTYGQLEKLMGVDGVAESDDTPMSDIELEVASDESLVEDNLAQNLSNAKEMDELFPDGEADSDVFSNFVIIIRNEAKPAKQKK